MATSPRCPGSGTREYRPYVALESGWPYARVECRHCGTYQSWTAAGVLRKHRGTETDNPYIRERRPLLDAKRAELGLH